MLIFSIFTGYKYSPSSRWAQAKRFWLHWVWKPQQPYQCSYHGWHSTFRHFELITAKQGCLVVLMFQEQEVVLSTQCIVYRVYCLHSVLSTQCIVYTVYCVHSVLCTQCIVYTVYCLHNVLSIQCTHCLCSSSLLALWLLQFGLGFPHDRCPFCYVQSFCSPVFMPIFLRPCSASSSMIQLFFFSLLLAWMPVNFFIVFVPSVLIIMPKPFQTVCFTYSCSLEI